MAPGAYHFTRPAGATPWKNVLSGLGGGWQRGGLLRNAPGQLSPSGAVPRPLPVPVLPTAPPLGAAPPSSIQTFDQWLANNPQWSQQQGLSGAARAGLYANYGWTRGADGRLVAATDAAPDSVLAGLGTRKARNIQGAAQAASNRGSLFSGATINEVDKATQAYESGISQAQSSLLRGLAGVDQQDLTTKISLGPGYEADVANTKIEKPADAISRLAGLKPGEAVAGYDAYLKAYEKYLAPNEIAEVKRQRDIAWKKFTTPKPPPVAPRTRPPVVIVDTKPVKAGSRKKKPGAGSKIRDGGIAGGHAR